jgi:hypothetical protein
VWSRFHFSSDAKTWMPSGIARAICESLRMKWSWKLANVMPRDISECKHANEKKKLTSIGGLRWRESGSEMKILSFASPKRA